MDRSGPMHPGQRLLAERRLVAALRRLHRREPLRSEIRIDAVLAELRRAPSAPARGHRGSAHLAMGDDGLRAVIDELAAAGTLVRRGRWVRLPEHRKTLDPQMRERVDRLLAGLREAGAAPPRIDGIAARLGIPPPLLDQLRASGELLSVAPGIDYPRDTWEQLAERVDAISASGPLTVARVRDGLRTSRRHAEAILAHRRAARRSVRPGRPAG